MSLRTVLPGAVLLTLLACSRDRAPVPDACSATSDCAKGSVCHDGSCRVVCSNDLDCDPSQACVDGLCGEGAGECQVDSDCPETTNPCQVPGTGVCRGGACRYKPAETSVACNDGDACTLDDHCDGTGRCTGESTCVGEIGESCSDDLQCASRFCESGVCCPEGADCCTRDSDCAGDFACDTASFTC